MHGDVEDPTQIYPNLVACADCDTISERCVLARGEQALCASCGGLLFRAGMSVDQLLALSLSAAILFIVANVLPVLGISLNGTRLTTTLWGSVTALADGGAAPIAIVVAAAIVVVPGLQIAVLCWLLSFARGGRRAPQFNLLIRIWERLHPWSMVEVGLLAVLVSFIKLKGLLHVEVGIGVWAMAALAVLLTAIAHRDVRSLWWELSCARR